MLSFSSSTAYTASNPVSPPVSGQTLRVRSDLPADELHQMLTALDSVIFLEPVRRLVLFVEVVELWYFVVCSLGVEEGRPVLLSTFFYIYRHPTATSDSI
jgi:hypothetical protein